MRYDNEQYCRVGIRCNKLMLNNTVDNCEQLMWLAQHCSSLCRTTLFSSRKENFTSSKIQKLWLKNVVMCGKYSFTKFANFLIVLRAEIVTTFDSRMVTISARNTIIRKFAKFARLYFPYFTTFRH